MVKIFCIGLNKTGTSSLHEALLILGFKSVHYKCNRGNIKKIIENNYNNNIKLLDKIEDFDAFSDWNFPHTNHLYQNFDEQYPNSKFILTIRDIDSWLLSREKHVYRSCKVVRMKKKYPDNPWYNIDKEAWIKEYNEHYDGVKDYFKNRKKDLLKMDIRNEDGWAVLCPFLNVEIPNIPFPHKNKAGWIKKILTFPKRFF